MTGAGSQPRVPLVMGIVNVTPDSFSDGGRFVTTEAAVAHGRLLLEQGADLLDIGGESTRPGAIRPDVSDELDRVVPVIRELAGAGAVVSVDTMRAEVAAAALEVGAAVVNDVSGGLADPAILDVVAGSDATYVAMHWRAHADRMRDFTDYAPDGVVATVCRELAERLDRAVSAGIPRERIVLDPGLGFAKKPHHNWELLRHLDQLAALGCPLLVGASRKSFLGTLLADDAGPRSVDEREHAHAALVALLASHGVDYLRVHDVRATRDALAVVASMEGPDMTDELAITGLECFAHHGVFDFERREGQIFVVDLVLGIDTSAAAASDDLAQTVNYGTLALEVKAAVERDPVDLIETVVQRIADVCLMDSRVEWTRVTLHKPDAPIDATYSDVALTITRTRGNAHD